MFLYLLSCSVHNNGDLIASIYHANHNNIDAGVYYEMLNNTINDMCKVNPEIAPKMSNEPVVFTIH